MGNQVLNMGLKADFDELIDEWGEKSLLSKVILGVSFFVTLSSITSLSDTVFKWKGFILEGITFYRTYISIHFRSFAEFLGLSYDVYFIDFYIINMLVFVIPSIRTVFLAYAFDQVGRRDNLIGFLSIYWTFVLLYFFNGKYFYWNTALITQMIVYSLAGVAYLWSRGQLIKAFVPSILALTIVLILAAINSGLTAPIN